MFTIGTQHSRFADFPAKNDEITPTDPEKATWVEVTFTSEVGGEQVSIGSQNGDQQCWGSIRDNGGQETVSMLLKPGETYFAGYEAPVKIMSIFEYPLT